MTSNAESAGERPLIGIYVIIAIQLLGLIYISYDMLFVDPEPQFWVLVVAGGITVAITIGLLRRSNVARLSLVFFACVSFFVTTVESAIVLLGTWSTLPTNAMLIILTGNLVSLLFTVWVVYYLTRTDVRERFAETTMVKSNDLRTG